MSKYLNDTGLAYFWEKIKAQLNTKVDKVSGKELSTNDFTAAYKTRLDNAMVNNGTVSDANDAKSAGYYHFNSNTPNAPGAAAYDCLVIPFGTDRIIQLVFRDTLNSDAYMYKRVYYSSSWGSWYRFSGTKL